MMNYIIRGLWYNLFMKSLITRDPGILGGKPIIAGTRMSVESVLELLASDMSTKEIIKEYPFLTKKQILACIEFAAKLSGRKEDRTKGEDVAQPQATPHEISR